MTVAKPDRPMRVLFVIDLNPSTKFGSLEEQCFVLSREFKRRDSLFLPVFADDLGPESLAEYQSAGVHAESLRLERFSVKSLNRLLDLIRRHKIELVHWNFYPALNLYLWALSLLTPSVKHYLTDHNSRELPIRHSDGILPKRMLKKVLLKRYSKVLCISDFVLDCLGKRGTWSNLSRCTYFVNTERFRPDAEARARVRRELQGEDQFIVTLVAHLIRGKGVDVALRGLKQLPDRVVLWIVGDGKELERLQSLSRDLSLENRVLFLGHQRNVEPFMQAADCLLCPSVWAEAVGLVNLEALATGLPVVASDIGGIPEFIEDGKTGLLFPPGDPKQLADKISSLESNPKIREAMGLEARNRAVQLFSPESRLDETLRSYSFSAQDEKPDHS